MLDLASSLMESMQSMGQHNEDNQNLRHWCFNSGVAISS